MNDSDTPTEKTPLSADNSGLPPDWLEHFEQATAELNSKLSLGLASKRETESWDEFTERVIQMFRDKGLFKNDRPA
jgi:hypothetical protein